MTRKPITNIPDSIRQRLLNKSKEAGRPYEEFLKYFAIERLLYRLGQSKQADRLVLKGGLTLRVWDAPLSRPTMDIDMSVRIGGGTDEVLGIIRECLSLNVPDDGLRFDDARMRVEPIRALKDVPGIRLLVPATLGTARIQVQIDIGFDDAVEPPPELLAFPTLLDHPPPYLRMYLPETVIAEKFQALVELETVNTRLKDFYDIWLLSKRRGFQGEVLAAAVTTTFRKRRTPLPVETPAALTTAFFDDQTKIKQWIAFLKQNRLTEGGVSLAEVAERLIRFLMPPIVETTEGPFSRRWNPDRAIWE